MADEDSRNYAKIIPPGLPRERLEYLYTKIREFVPEDKQDIVCPHPDSVPIPVASPDHSPTTQYAPKQLQLLAGTPLVLF